MYKILNKQQLAPDIKRLDILAEDIARKIKPGQFIMVSADEYSQRIPLTVVDNDPQKGTIALIFQEADASSQKLGALPINEPVHSILGPLGVPARIEKYGVVVCIATGMGAAQILPVCRALKKAGNKVIGVIGAKTKKSLMLEAQMRLCCNKVFIATNDGSYIRRGLATDVLKEVLVQEKPNLVYAIGSVEMMDAAAKLTREKSVKMLVSVNPVMLDGTGMCGSCRVVIGGKTVLACVEGPEFDGHHVDYKDLNIRMNAVSTTQNNKNREMAEWDNPRLTPNPGINASRTLTKLLSGILKSKP